VSVMQSYLAAAGGEPGSAAPHLPRAGVGRPGECRRAGVAADRALPRASLPGAWTTVTGPWPTRGRNR